MFRFIMAMTVLAVTGCAMQESSQITMNELNQRFVGQKAADFFISYGKPINYTASDDGGRLYRWASIEQGEAPITPVYRAQSSAGAMPVAGAGQAMGAELYCELKIETDQDNRIRKLSIVHDSAGKWSNSRCLELFKVK